jgi:hypothetical protein
MSEFSRRGFMATTAGAVAATGLSQAVTRAQSPNDTIRVAVLGVNGRGREHLDVLAKQPGVQVTALCDPDEKILATRAKAVEEKQGRPVATATDMRRIFDRDDVDAVTVATPNHWHSLATIWACQAGKDVYVEKPGSHNIFEGRKMIEAAHKYQRIVQHGVQLRSSPAIQEAIQHLRNGLIGDVYMARGLVFRWRPSIGNQARRGPAPKPFELGSLAGPCSGARLLPATGPLQLALALGLWQRRCRESGDSRNGPLPMGAGRRASLSSCRHGRQVPLG